MDQPVAGGIFPYFADGLFKRGFIALRLRRPIDLVNKICDLPVRQIVVEGQQRVQVSFQQTRQCRQNDNIGISGAGIT